MVSGQGGLQRRGAQSPQGALAPTGRGVGLRWPDMARVGRTQCHDRSPRLGETIRPRFSLSNATWLGAAVKSLV